MRLRVTDHGRRMLREGEAVLDELREAWEREAGASSVAALEETLGRLVGGGAIRLDAPGWLARDPAQPE